MTEDHKDLLGLSDRDLRLRSGDATHQHFKGGLYRLLGRVRDAMTGDHLCYRQPRAEVMIYEHVYPHKRELWARPAHEFEQEVEWHDGSRGPRFRPLR